MSIVALKRKSDEKYGSILSGKPDGGTWISRGPFGNHGPTINAVGYSGFSLNGGTRNYGYVGKTYGFSTNSTPFKGIYAKGNGGNYRNYATSFPQLGAEMIITRGTQSHCIKPSVLSTRGMLRKKNRWIGRPYPHSTVQPMSVHTALSLNTSQGLYIDNLSSRANIHHDINQFNKYAVILRPTRYCSNNICSISAKNIRNAKSSSENLHRKKQPCSNIEAYPTSINGNALRHISFSNISATKNNAAADKATNNATTTNAAATKPLKTPLQLTLALPNNVLRPRRLPIFVSPS
jgi:hypothetical protein